ncbi:hypothetical protein TNCV_4724681 [Trichonephila clavipes]|uniref:Uncharacterized protein n=1 Tax=Trichonephila clavipes TaxID=2585209 RepID=A0A8X7BFD5_TRICX|nr:hypothetical protein TNCV_4724681 [Trichonephila clavipes]
MLDILFKIGETIVSFYGVLGGALRVKQLLSVVTYATCPRNSSWQGVSCTPVIIRSFEQHTSDITILARFHPNFEGERPGSGQRPANSLPLPPTSPEDLRFDGYLEYPHAAKALYMNVLYMPSPGFSVANLLHRMGGFLLSRDMESKMVV